MRYLAFDLETTGVDVFSDVPVSYAFVERDPVVADAFLVHEALVDPGMSIPPGASAIHGITDDMVRGATQLEEALEAMATAITELWHDGGVLVGMNVAFDLTMLDAALRARGHDGLDGRGPIGAVIDVLILDRHYDKWRKGPRRLADLARQYGVALYDAHSAAADATASLLLLEAMITLFPEVTSLLTSDTTAQLRAWHREWLTSFSRYLERKGEPAIEAGRYDWPLHRAH